MEICSLWQNKKGIHPSYSIVITIVSLHHSNFNETPIEKARSELHKDATCYLEQILKGVPYKTVVL